eukprot:TRINITY_DN1455_c0_g1_i2.p5 TRINITY_DN1455_c0_g1~~TRINITY_DN1455_c0_g1_i2.p5  ORF type:complete len:118 (+),score=4.42 TRINITY_DN1455_c0_g1_i2:274-627(+)
MNALVSAEEPRKRARLDESFSACEDENTIQESQDTTQVLPDEMLAMVFAEMDTLIDIARCSKTCRRWSPMVWPNVRHLGEVLWLHEAFEAAPKCPALLSLHIDWPDDVPDPDRYPRE